MNKGFILAAFLISTVANAAPKTTSTTPKFDKFLIESKLETHNNYLDRLRALATELIFHVATLSDYGQNLSGIRCMGVVSNAEIIISKLINAKISSVEPVLNEVVANAPKIETFKYFQTMYSKIKDLLPDSGTYYYGVPTLALPVSVLGD
ncbi:MAG TPA: hypothetical protein VFF04_00955 [Candidatus Babeliales bacterium]|nr:hypothetical protein [Candidatus Babeliales bacterium]